MKNVFIRMTSLHLQKMGLRIRAVALIAFCLTLTSQLVAQRGSYAKKSTVTIESWDNRPFTIEIDGRRYQADGSITLRDLTPGQKRVRVVRNNSGFSSHLNHGRTRGRGSVLYNGFIEVNRSSRIRAKITKNRTLRILSRTAINSRPSTVRPRPQRPSQGSCGAPNYSYDHDYGYEEELQYEDEHGFEPYSVEHSGHYGGACAMENSEFDGLLWDIEDACFTDDKIRLVRQVLRHNLISVSQLEEIMHRFTFDSGKLEVATLSYEYVIDKENTWKLYDAFSFSSTASDFEEHVLSCG